MKLAKSPVHAQNCVDKVNSAAVEKNQGVQKRLNGEKENLRLMQSSRGTGCFWLNPAIQPALMNNGFRRVAEVQAGEIEVGL